MPNTKIIRKSNRRKTKVGGYRKRINSKKSHSKKRNSKRNQSKKRKGGIRVRKTKRVRGGIGGSKFVKGSALKTITKKAGDAMDILDQNPDTVKSLKKVTSNFLVGNTSKKTGADAQVADAQVADAQVADNTETAAKAAAAETSAEEKAAPEAEPAAGNEVSEPAAGLSVPSGLNSVDVPPELGSLFVELILKNLQAKLEKN